MTDCLNQLNAFDSTLSIIDLPEDVLNVVLGYCDFKTLLNVAQVCRSLNILASQDSLWRPVSKKCVNRLPSRRHNAFSLKDYCRISFNWVRGQYSATTLVDFSKKLLPWLHLENNGLYVSIENGVKTFNHHRGKKRISKPVSSIICGRSDITRFVVKRNMLISGCMGKTVTIWNLKDKPSTKRRTFLGHTAAIHCVDILGDIVISGSRDRSIKLWSLSLGECVTSIQVGDPIRSVAVNSFNRTFVSGSAGYSYRHSPLRLFDCEMHRQLCELVCDSTERRGAGILDMKFESPNILLSCGYDTAVRLWDMRTNLRCCVRKWEDPHDSTIYCIDSDKTWMILSGTNRYGVVRLWDKRMHRNIKSYYVSGRSTSPVYSLKFDQTKLFVALDTKVNILNFEKW